jgi:3-methyl-2-oxobutanoate hydroxymethyltransferase
VRTTLSDIRRWKKDGRRIPMLTAYDFAAAQIADRAGVPLLLVGDSLGMVMQGYDTTLPVTLDDMVRHAAAVVRGAQSAMVIADLPFLTYTDTLSAVTASRRLMQEAQVQAVKLEGGGHVASIVEHLVQHGVPVMGHLGFTPQSQHTLGVRVQAKRAACAKRLLEDALALQKAGAFALVLELVPAPLAAEVSRRLRIPTIGIGAGAGCDGQVQVWHDLLGFFESSPRHARRYAEIGAAVETAIRAYAADVEGERFPTADQSSGMDADELAKALA